MAGSANGKPVEIKQEHQNGTIHSKSVPRTRQKQGIFAWTLSTATRLLIWYAVAVALFWCPSSVQELDDTSSQICKPYLTIRSHASPYIQPYYDSYVAPYADVAKPYVNTVQNQVMVPVIRVGKETYNQYGAPQVEKVRSSAHAQWQTMVKPQLDIAQSQAKKHYDANLAPHVDKATAAGAPYYEAGRENILTTYNQRVLPAYDASRPYAEKAYTLGHKVVVETGFPYLKWSLAITLNFLNRTLLPRIKILYGENVEPQLVKISQRLGRYRDGKDIMAAVDEVDKSEEQVSTSSSLLSMSSSISSAASVASVSASVAVKQAPKSESSDRPDASEAEATEAKKKLAQETIKNDLEKWKLKFVNAAHTAADDLVDRVDEIVAEQKKNQVEAVGESLQVQLEETVTAENARLKKTINKIVAKLPDEAAESDTRVAIESVNAAIRDSGLAVRTKAQALRSWKEKFTKDIKQTVFLAAQTNVEVLSDIRDLGLQEIGMKWAWMDGVTYKDWKKYHALKKDFEIWRNEVRDMGLEHEGMVEILAAADDIEAKGMGTAETFASELLRLKDVGIWKVKAADNSDDWTSRTVPAQAAAAAKKVKDGVAAVKDEVFGSSQGSVESASSKFSEQASSKISEAISGSAQPATESIVSAAQDKFSEYSEAVAEGVKGSAKPVTEQAASSAKSAASDVSEAVVGSEEPVTAKIASSVKDAVDSGLSQAEAATSIVRSAASSGSEAAVGSSSVEAESAASKASKKAKSAASEVSESVVPDSDPYGTQSAVSQFSEDVESGSSKVSSVASDASSAASEFIDDAISGASGSSDSISAEATATRSKIFAGAMAQEVPKNSGPILDDILDDVSDATEAFADAASDKYAEALESASSAISAVQVQYESARIAASMKVRGTPKAAHEEALASLESGYSDFVTAAGSRLNAAWQTASAQVYPPTSPGQSVLDAANDKYSQALSFAGAQFESAKEAVGATPTPAHESLLSEASQKYAELTNSANEQYASATHAASSAVYGTPTGALESISALASSRLSEGLQLASDQYSSALAALEPSSTPIHIQYAAEARRKYYEALGVAHERYSGFYTAASEAAYGTPTPVYERYYSVASEKLYGPAPAGLQLLFQAGQDKYAEATSMASDAYEAAVASASSVAGVSETPVAQSIINNVYFELDAAVAAASSHLSESSKAASALFYGTETGKIESMTSAASAAASSLLAASETPWGESAASQASQNWEVLVSRASQSVYGPPTPFADAVYSQAADYAAQATEAAAAQFVAVQELVSELVAGKEPDFAESIMSRLDSAYSTGMPAVASSASSYASEAYGSASSVLSSVFSTPPTVEAIIDDVSDQVSSALDAASIQIYGSEKGTWEKATSAAADSYSSAEAKVSEAVSGSQTGYAEIAQSSIEEAAASASSAISAAIYGTTIDTYESATSAASEAYSSAYSAAESAASQVSSKASAGIYGPEQGALESAAARLSNIVDQARAQLSKFSEDASDGAKEAVESVQSNVEEMASSLSNVVSSATDRVKDEL